MDAQHTFLLCGTGDVIEPDDGIIAIGSGGMYALSAGRALLRNTELSRQKSPSAPWRSPAKFASTPTAAGAGGGLPVSKAQSFTPREIVSELDRYIVGQDAAKRAVAIALRNRWRRQQLPPSCATRSRRRTSS